MISYQSKKLHFNIGLAALLHLKINIHCAGMQYFFVYINF